MNKYRKIIVVALSVVMCLSLAACEKKSSSVNDEKTSDAAEEISKDFTDYKNVISVLCDAKVKADLDEFMLLFGDMEELMASVVTQDILDETKQNYTSKCGDNIKIEWDITSEEKASDEDIASYQDTISMFGENGKIEEAIDLVVEVKAKGDDGTYEYELTVSVGKIDGEWLLVNFDDTLLK